MLEAHRGAADLVLLPLARRLRAVNPNYLSWLAFLVALAAGASFYLASPSYLLVGIILVLLNALLDGLDGRVAKITGRESPRGDFLDHVLDRYADILMIGGIALGGYGDVVFGLFAILGVLLASYMGTQAQAVGLGRDYGGLLGRADRLAVLFVAGWAQLLLDPAGRGLGWFTPLEWALLVFAILGQLTAVQRAVSSWRRLGAA